MSTEIAPSPVKTTTSLWSEISNHIKLHHDILKLVIVAVLIWTLSGKAETLWANHEQKVFDAKSAVLRSQADANAQQAATNAQIAGQNAALAAQYKDLATQVLAENTKLEQANAALVAATKKQQQQDSTLPPAGLAARWETLAQLPVTAVTPNTDGTFGVTGAAALQTVSQLELVPELQSELNNDQIEITNDKKQLASQTEVVNGLNQQVGGLQTEVTGLQTQNAEEVKVCAAQVADVKAKAAKSKRKWFVIGYVAGFVSGVFVAK